MVILDTAGGEWLALNATAGDFWRAWDAGAGFEDALHQVAARYPRVPSDALRADAEHLKAELMARGLLTAVSRPVPPVPAASPAASSRVAGGASVMAETATPHGMPRPRWPRTWLALWVLLAACLVVRCSPFRYQLALVRATRRWCRRPADSGEAAVAVAAVSWAVRRYPGRAACLERSLAAVLLAAASRRRLDWCLGAVADPYRFHAWVETEGHPVSAWDDPSSPFGYIRLISV